VPTEFGKVRAPGDAGSAERVEDLAEERVGRPLAPALGRNIDWSDLQINLLVLSKLEELFRGLVGWAIFERRTRQVIQDDRDLGKAIHDLPQQRQALLLHLHADRNVFGRRVLPERIGLRVDKPRRLIRQGAPGKERWVCACGSDTGSGQLSGRAARGSTFRKAACGSAFRCLFIPCKAADPRI
jgi:hypothetical protein